MANEFQAAIDKLKDFEQAAAELVSAIAKAFPLGRNCAIRRTRKGDVYYIYGTIYGHPTIWVDQSRLLIKTAKRGTILGAHFRDIKL